VRPAKPGKLRGRGRVVRRGRDIAFLAGELTDGDDIIATATASAIVRHRD
jgi:acyl-coenzyme A thioesterase PaaI-like protein